MTDHQQRKSRLRREWLLTAAIALLLLGLFVFGSLARPLGNVVYDHFMRLHGFRATQDIVIISIDDRSLHELGGWPLRRSVYADLARQLNDDRFRPKALGIDLLFLDPTPDDDALATQLSTLNAVLPLEFKVQEDAHQGYAPSPPVGPLAHAARLGHINLSFDDDGVIRGFQPQDPPWLHFALAMHAAGKPQTQPSTPQNVQRFRMVDPRVGFPMVSLSDALHNDFTKTLLKNKFVLLGVTAPSLSDRYPTLYSGKNNASTPGVAILASILNASLNHAFIAQAHPLIVFGSAALVTLAMLQSLVLLRPRHSLLLSLALILLSVVLSYYFLTLADLWINPVPFILVALVVQPLWAWRRLEAIVHVVQDKAADLHQFQTAERAPTGLRPSREVVLKYGNLLDQAVASARSELDFLATIVDEMPDAVAIFDNRDELLLCNRQLKALVNHTQLQNGTPMASVIHTLGLPIGALIDVGTLAQPASQQPVFSLQTRLGAKDFYVKNTQLASPMGGHLRLFILMDITELRQSQLQRDRALQFLSHDMRTPVASIMSITQHDGLGKIERDKIRHHSKALLNMMDDFILTISAEAQQYALKEELLDNILNDAIEHVSDLAHAKGIRVRDESQDNSIFVMANTRLLVRALVNLLFNAVKFSPPNSTITVCIHDNVASHTARISIINPVHITDDAHDLTPSMPGFGLGLDFVDTVIRKHNGSLSRDIPAHQGTAQVHISLPSC